MGFGLGGILFPSNVQSNMLPPEDNSVISKEIEQGNSLFEINSRKLV